MRKGNIDKTGASLSMRFAVRGSQKFIEIFIKISENSEKFTANCLPPTASQAEIALELLEKPFRTTSS